MVLCFLNIHETVTVMVQVQKPIAIEVERHAEMGSIMHKQVPLVCDAGSLDAQGLVTSWSSPALLMVKMGFTAGKYQVKVLRIPTPGGEPAGVQKQVGIK